MSRPSLVSCLISVALCSCVAPFDEPVEVTEPDPAVAEVSAGLQLSYGNGVHLADRSLNTTIARSTAALRLSNVSPTMPVASCGLTWVSQHYGVTAAHCVDHLPIRYQGLVVEEVLVDQLDLAEFIASMVVVGDWNTGWQPGTQLTSGYGTIRYPRCYVSRRCDPNNGGRQGCPIPENVDIALVKCPDRQNREHAKTTSAVIPLGFTRDIDDVFTLNVNTWWFHEVYSLPTEDDGTERWQHYGRYLGETRANDNWHYTRAHQLLPLVSIQFPDGTLYRTIPSNRAVLNDMDTPICHGTSGSGVFIHGTNIFLGPAVSAGIHSEIGGRLCEPADRVVPGTSRATYVRGVITDAFVRNSREVATDY